MTSLLEPLELDSYEVQIARPASGGSGYSGVDSLTDANAPAMQETSAQLKSYSGWNGIAVRKFCDLASAKFPQLGMADAGSSRDAVERRRSRLTRQQTQHWDTYYRDVYQSIELERVRPIDRHVLIDLFKYVNDEETWSDLLFDINLFLELAGCCYLWAVPSQFKLPSGHQLPMELTVIPTNWVEEVRNAATGVLEGYRIVVTSYGVNQKVLTADEVIPFKIRSSTSKSGWTSPSQQGAEFIDASKGINQSRVAQMNNAGRPSMVLVPQGEVYSKMSPEKAESIAFSIQSRAAQIKNHGKPLVTPPGFDVHNWSSSPKDMDYLATDDQLRDAIFALRGTSKFIAGITADMNRADTEAAYAQTCDFAINPRLRFIAGRLTEKLASRFDPRLLVWFESATPRNWERELEEDKFDSQFGALLPQEVRARRNREPIEHELMNTPWFSSGMIPADMADSPEADPDDDEGDGE